MLNLQNLAASSLHPLYRVSSSSSISAQYLSKCSVHPASTSSAPDMMLWGNYGTVNGVFAFSGSLGILSAIVVVVAIGVVDGVSNNVFLVVFLFCLSLLVCLGM